MLYDLAARIGGQFNMAKRIPGKEEFHETLRYFGARLAQAGVETRLNTRVDAALLQKENFDDVVFATGVNPRRPAIAGVDHAKVVNYLDVLLHDAPVGPRVALIGAGGIGFDMAEFLTQAQPSPTTDVARWSQEWGVDIQYRARGALAKPAPEPSERTVWLLQRTPGKPGERLNKTTGWVHRAALKAKGVTMLAGVDYRRIDDDGLHIVRGGNEELLAVDTVVLCAGQEPNRSCRDEAAALGIRTHVIGGADVAAELDAKRAIAQGTRLAATI